MADGDVSRISQNLDLLGKNLVEAVIVAHGGDDGRVRGQRHRRKAAALFDETTDELVGRMPGVGGAAIVEEE
jgi:hypothetical protein